MPNCGFGEKWRMKPQDVVVFEEKLSGFAAWKWVFFRAWEIDALALGDESPGAFGICRYSN